MEVVVAKPLSKNAKRRARKASKKSQQTTIVVNNSGPKSNRRRRNRNKKGRISQKLSERAYFERALLMPDVVGPIRVPRSSGGSRTGLAIDFTEYTITGSATNTILGAQMVGGYSLATPSGMNVYAATSATTAFGSPSTVTPSVQYPPAINIADINQTAGSFILFYTGNPLNVQGEVIIGCSINILTTSNYNTMVWYPGTIRIPVAELIGSPKRVSLRKLSPVSDEFIPITSGTTDMDFPFVFTNGLPTGGTLKVIGCRTWEYRSTTNATNVVPYEKVGPSHSGDVMAYMDAKANIADSPIVITDVADTGDFTSSLGLPGTLGSLSAAAAGLSGFGLLANRHLNRARAGFNLGPNFRGYVNENFMDVDV